ncbi:unnamed protein product [Scytosiphon promiscuus]
MGGDDSISGVCCETGLNIFSYFDRQFRLIVNCFPSTFLGKHKMSDRDFEV